MSWTLSLYPAAQDELVRLPPGLQGQMLRLFGLVESLGLERMREPHVKHLEGKLWELRAKSAEGIARGIYVAAQGRRVVVLHIFEKKSQKTPQRALEMAMSRLARLSG